VLGVIPAENLGVTIAHEHVFVSTVGPNFVAPDNPADAALAEEPLRPDIRAWVEANWTKHRDNLVLDDVDVAVAELTRYHAAGGQSLIDMSNVGLSRNPRGLVTVSSMTGINITMGCGYYHDATHPAYVRDREERLLAEEMISDIQVGVDGTGIRAGVVGEIGCSWPLTDSERKVLRAAATAQREVGCGLSVHPGRHPSAPFEILAILEDAGADVGRVIIGHIQRTIFDVREVVELANTGCFVEYDLFGMEANASFFWEQGIELPSDGQRLDQLQHLIAAGLGAHILVAQDICQKHRLCAYGGHGYEHIPRQIVPRMRARGFTNGQVEAILIDNPRRAFAIELDNLNTPVEARVPSAVA